MISPNLAAKIVAAWREEIDDNSLARTYVSLAEAMPDDDPEAFARTVWALTVGIAGTITEAESLMATTGAVLERELAEDGSPDRFCTVHKAREAAEEQPGICWNYDGETDCDLVKTIPIHAADLSLGDLFPELETEQ